MIKVVKWKTGRVTLIVSVVSLFLSLIKLSEYAMAQTSYDYPDQFVLFDLESAAALAYFVLDVIHYFLNDAVFLLLNLIIDIKLVTFIKKGLREKENLKNKLEISVQPNQVEQLDTKNRENSKKAKSIENKANSMIVADSLLYLFCRLPELLGRFFFYFIPYAMDYGTTCRSIFACSLISNLIEYFYMLSFLFNLLIYYKFNSNFQIGFRKFFGMKIVAQQAISKPHPKAAQGQSKSL